jgi:uronate dehydrogenase/NAD+ dependent glucose-6-phosphate dehydrogenase
MYSTVHGLSCLCLRFGWVNAADHPRDTENLTLWSSHQDMLRCVELCINAPESLGFDTFFSVSNSRYRWVDIEHTRNVIGYVPQDWADEFLKKR